jgi:hypothetical protein
MTDLARVEKLIAEATPGPWEVKESVYRYGEDFHPYVAGVKSPDYCIATLDDGSDEDAAFIAHMRQLAPLMLEVVKDANAYLNEYGSSVDLDNSLEALDAYITENLDVTG